MNVLLAVLWKDLVTEWRRRDRMAAMLVFALLVVVIFFLAAPAGSEAASRTHLPGLLWVAYLFAALLGLERAFAQELENDALSLLALAPADRGWIYLGKAGATLVMLLVLQGLCALAFALAFGLDLRPVALPLAGVALLGAVGVCAAGTLFSAVAARTAWGQVLLPLLLLPLLVPVLLGAVRATAALLDGEALPRDALQLLVVTDAVFLILSFATFEYVLDE